MNTTRPITSTRTGLFLTVFTTGAAVMVIELLGTRMIAPFYGTSLTVWSALISVTMIALADGIFYRWPLGRPRRTHTGSSLIIALAGLFTLLIPWLTRPVLLATDALGTARGCICQCVGCCFRASLTMLGMVSPFAIKLADIAFGRYWQ